jgi:hypothetical protein
VWELGADEAGPIVAALAGRRGFAVDLSHLTVVGRCADCGDREASPGATAAGGAGRRGQQDRGRAPGGRRAGSSPGPGAA